MITIKKIIKLIFFLITTHNLKLDRINNSSLLTTPRVKRLIFNFVYINHACHSNDKMTFFGVFI